ncbi:hypothetical protein [Microbulbifer sp. TRSA005]|uniref:hypothetical protein n=1 Tax=unclassified Microbulbifer TaxID=2619833 RepID=UPI00403A3A78
MEEIIGGILRPIGRFLVEVVFQIIFELLFHFPGYFICKVFIGGKSEPKDGWIFLTSVLFWLIVAVVGYSAYSFFSGGGNA